MFLPKDKYWRIIHRIDWAKNCEMDPEELHENLKDACVDVGMTLDEVEERTHQNAMKLLDLVRDASQNKWIVKLDYYSDDSMNDCIAHVIGLGKAEYEKCLGNVQHLIDRYNGYDFVESFSYIFVRE